MKDGCHGDQLTCSVRTNLVMDRVRLAIMLEDINNGTRLASIITALLEWKGLFK
tara:strand:- start:250 stop:411 length:162 start_codon:yes stop_codon:yes gene_type:complete